jgi:FlaA1/EpsC-like NDP-sugar epimerase
MRSSFVTLSDVVLLVAATLFALLLRENFDLSTLQFFDVAPYFLVTAIAAGGILHGTKLGRVRWRFGSLPDYQRLFITVTAIVITTVAIMTVYSRLKGIPRSLPLLQILIGTGTLMLPRILSRLRYTAQQARAVACAKRRDPRNEPAHAVLLLGSGRLTETYLQAIDELAPGRIRVAGLLGQAETRGGRLVAGYPVLGRPESVASILDELETQGIQIDRIILTDPVKTLSHTAYLALRMAEQSGRVRLQFLAEELGFGPGTGQGATVTALAPTARTQAGTWPPNVAVVSPRPQESSAVPPHVSFSIVADNDTLGFDGVPTDPEAAPETAVTAHSATRHNTKT